MTNFSSFIQYSVPSGRRGVRIINQQVLDSIKQDQVGFYTYTKNSAFAKGEFKIGQTIVGAIDRVGNTISASDNEVLYITDWVASGLALTPNSDVDYIHRVLHKSGDAVWTYSENKQNSPGTEWSRFDDHKLVPSLVRKCLDGNQSRIDLNLTIWQLEVIDKLLTQKNDGLKFLMYELAARFGKTTTYLAFHQMVKEQVMILPSYVTTVFSSFENEIFKFNQFKDFILLDASNPYFHSQWLDAIQTDKKIVVITSLCGSSNVEKNIPVISNFKDKIVVVDEADYGAHTENVAPTVSRISNGCFTVLTTGTNSERAKGNHTDIDGFHKVTYFDMLMKRESDLKLTNDIPFDRNFKFEDKLASVKFYRQDWSRFVPIIDESEKDLDITPSFSKAAKDVQKSRSFWTGLFDSLIGNHKDVDANDFNLDQMIGEDVVAVQQFLPGSMNKKQQAELLKIAKAQLSDFYDVVLINGDFIKGKFAEDLVKLKIRESAKKGRKVWVLTTQMCQRSFSVPDINVVLLTYDNGDEGATIQKMSRALTSGDDKTIGHIISLSIDGNRDDKIAPIIMDTAETLAEQEDISIVEALRKVMMKSIPIFQMNEDGDQIQLQPDKYAEEIFSTSKGIRIAMNKDKITFFDTNETAFDILTSMNVVDSKMKQQITMLKGKTFKSGEKKDREVSTADKNQIIDLIRKNVQLILDNLAISTKIYGDMSYDELIDLLNSKDFVSDQVGVTGTDLNILVESNYIHKNILQMYVEL